MNNYDFSTLNDKDFEKIVKDLLNAEFHLGLQDFKIGKDKGIDLRYSSPTNNNEIVVQAKHYVGSKYAQLKYILINEEFAKVKNLNPNRYIVATSLSLSAPEKDEIKEIFKPYILSSNDVITKEDLNGYLNIHEEIHKKHFKLWFSSISVLEQIFNNAVEGRTLYDLERIKNIIPFYVITEKFDDANKILNKEKLLLITGQPGIGKTTLGDIIFFNRAKDGYRVHKVYNIKEAESVISLKSSVKQLFYYDDFLGESYLEIINNNKIKSELTSFIDRIKNTPNKYLILATRTVILNLAIEKYEKLNHSKLSNKQFELKLEDYSKYEKALILYNKLYFNKLPPIFYECIIKEKFYNDIISHQNYTPRIIEFITDKSLIEHFNSEQYHEFILNNLKNPQEIWRYSFNNQISYVDKCLLITLFTFPSSVYENELFNAFEIRMNYEKEFHNQIINSDQFYESIRILINGFISSIIYNIKKPVRSYSFINPSLRDFLIGYLKENYQEKKNIILSMLYFEQLNSIFAITPNEKVEIELQEIIKSNVEENKIKIIESNKNQNNNNYTLVTKIKAILNYCTEIKVDDLLLKYLKELDLNDLGIISNEYEFILFRLENYPVSFSYIKDNFVNIIEHFINAIDDEDIAENIPDLFIEYDYNYEEYIEEGTGINKLKDLIKDLILKKEEEEKSKESGEVKNFEDVDKIYYKITDKKYELISCLLPNVSFDFEINIDNDYWNDTINDNIEFANTQEDYYDHYKDEINHEISENELIDDLFS